MFTGIIETTAPLINVGSQLSIGRPASFTDLAVGQSIAVSGVCLTLVAFDASSMAFDVVPETLARTNLGSKHAGDRVNLERALAANGRFEGHIVQGHVEGVAEVAALTDEGEGKRLTVRLPDDLARYVIPKGSIAIDGTSLTVAAIDDQKMCSIALIPHTLSWTTLGGLRPGDGVNIETDVLVRALLHQHRG